VTEPVIGANPEDERRPMTHPTAADRLATQFEAQRAYLRAVAFRMLGSVAEAEDVVQDAWLRLNRADDAEVDNLRAWLTTVVARLSLDVLRRRRRRPEEPSGMQLPDPIVSFVGAPGPESNLLAADAVGAALVVVLDTLSPLERLAFVLHDVFGLPFEEIAPIVDRSVTATRQLASRGRRRVRGAEASGVTADPARQDELVRAFLAASRAGDFEALLGVLDPDVVLRADTGSLFPGAERVVNGARRVAKVAEDFRSLAGGARHAWVNGMPGVVVYLGDRPYAVLAFTVRGGRIRGIDIVADPQRVRRLVPAG
jgi:RNA polymerase sigma factor (sigma-70 family)